MKIILLFDSDRIDNCYREYEVSSGLDAGFRKGGKISVTFCHPDNGEMMEIKADVSPLPGLKEESRND